MQHDNGQTPQLPRTGVEASRHALGKHAQNHFSERKKFTTTMAKGVSVGFYSSNFTLKHEMFDNSLVGPQYNFTNIPFGRPDFLLI